MGWGRDEGGRLRGGGVSRWRLGGRMFGRSAVISTVH